MNMYEEFAVHRVLKDVPLVVVLHGFCERGRPLQVVEQLPPWLLRDDQISVVAPVLTSGLWCEEKVLQTIQPIIKRSQPSSVRLLGISIGGNAVWNLLALDPRLFDTAVVIASVPHRSIILDLSLCCIGLRITRHPLPRTRIATRVIVFVGQYDPLLLGPWCLPNYAELTRVPNRCHRIWDVAFSDTRVQTILTSNP